MKRTGIAIALAGIFTLPASALEGVPQCASGPVDMATVKLLQEKLATFPTADPAPVAERFYSDLACLLLDSGAKPEELTALDAHEILNLAIDQQSLTRSRADALLAILKAMRQAMEEPPAPVPAK